MAATIDDARTFRSEVSALLDSLGGRMEVLRSDAIGQPLVDDLEEILDAIRTELELLG